MLLPLLCGWLLGIDAVVLDRPLPSYLHGQEFHAVVASPLTATWDNVPLRSLLRRLSESQRVGILLDRRVDPTTSIQFTLTGQPLRSGLEDLAARVRAGVCWPGYVAFIAPPETTEWVRTTIEQRELELTGDGTTIPEPRQLRLLARKTIHWQDLETPRQILEQIGQRYELEIRGLDQVPHDLWASATLPYATCAEALSLVLVQYDLDFTWSPDGTSVDLTPWQRPALIERRYTPRGRKTAAATLASWQADLPHLQGRVERNEILVVGRVEDHDQVRALMSPTARSTPEPPASQAPLRLRRLTLKVENVPIAAIMREFEKSGVTFRFDADQLRQAGIDLNTPVSLDVNQVDADEFFRILFRPLDLTFTIDDREVELRPKPQ